MRDDIIHFLEEDIRGRCESPNNFFGMGIYCHIKAVVKNAVRLAEEYGGDREVVTVAAWLHDIAAVTDYQYYEEHHIHGARMAGELLRGMDYPAAKVELVQNCILNHRGSVAREKTTVEEVCVADADAISHFDSVPSLLYLAYVKRGYSIEEGTEFVVNKLKRSYGKLSGRSRELYREKYRSALELLCGEAP